MWSIVKSTFSQECDSWAYSSSFHTRLAFFKIIFVQLPQLAVCWEVQRHVSRDTWSPPCHTLTLAARMEQMATDMRFMEGSSNARSESITSRAQWYLSKVCCRKRKRNNHPLQLNKKASFALGTRYQAASSKFKMLSVMRRISKQLRMTVAHVGTV